MLDCEIIFNDGIPVRVHELLIQEIRFAHKKFVSPTCHPGDHPGL